jgi:cobalt-zinc-cadmium efflux system protein
MGHSHTSHDHYHAHHSHAPSSQRVLSLALLLTLGFAVVEAVAGWMSGSLALFGDAGHMFTDGLSLGLASFTAWLAGRKPSTRHSYGFGRSELLAAVFNALFMIAIVVAISVAAVQRLLDPPVVNGATVSVVAFVGLIINILVAWLLSRSESNINVRAALLHVLGDLLGSVAALISGLVITATGWYPIDPVLSLVIVLLIMFSSVRLLREGLHLLMDGVPARTDLKAVGLALAEIDGVREVHDLHIWSLSADRIALTAHLLIDDLTQWPQLLSQARLLLASQFNIEHITIQPELSIDTTHLVSIQEPEK